MLLAPSNFYPRPPGGGRHHHTIIPHALRDISIHALRVEGDQKPRVKIQRSGISIHALRVEGDKRQNHHLLPLPYFYPRPPGGGRPTASRITARRRDFYPRPPGGGRRSNLHFHITFLCISIHALRVEGDCFGRCFGITSRRNFYPRPPGGGRRSIGSYTTPSAEISIHALRVEGDRFFSTAFRTSR